MTITPIKSIDNAFEEITAERIFTNEKQAHI